MIPISSEKFSQPYYLHYDTRSNCPYSTDYVGRNIWRFDFHEKRTYTATIENNIVASFNIPVEGTKNRFIVCGNFSVFLIEWNGIDSEAKVVRDLITVLATKKDPVAGWDYGKVSPTGEFYGGSFHPNMCSKSSEQCNAALYHNDKPIEDFKKICVSGAIDWNVDKNLLYHVYTCDPVVREFKWDPKSCIQQNFVRLWKWMLEIRNDVKFKFGYICSISSTNVLGPFHVLGFKKRYILGSNDKNPICGWSWPRRRFWMPDLKSVILGGITKIES